MSDIKITVCAGAVLNLHVGADATQVTVNNTESISNLASDNLHETRPCVEPDKRPVWRAVEWIVPYYPSSAQLKAAKDTSDLLYGGTIPGTAGGKTLTLTRGQFPVVR